MLFFHINRQIVLLITEGLGIRSIARILQISATTLLKRMIVISDTVSLPLIKPVCSYEIDELCTFVKCKRKRIWIVYAFERESKNIVGFNVGKHFNVKKSFAKGNPISVFADKLKSYQSLIPKCIYKAVRFGTNNIEMVKLTLSTQYWHDIGYLE